MYEGRDKHTHDKNEIRSYLHTNLIPDCAVSSIPKQGRHDLGVPLLARHVQRSSTDLNTVEHEKDGREGGEGISVELSA